MADSDVSNIIKRLAKLLNQETVDRVLDAGDRRLLHPDQVAMLAQLHTFFRGQTAESEEERDEDKGPRGRPRRGRRAGKAAGNTTRNEMMRLAKDVRPHPLVTELLDSQNCTASIFLAGRSGGEGGDEDLADFPSQLENCRENGKQNVAFAHCVHFLETIEKRNVLDAGRKCFLYLFFFDITLHLNQVNNTTHTGSRMGQKQKENALNLLAGNFFERVFVDPEECKEVKKKVDKWTKRGKKLDQLCEAFDEGALLILADKLSEDMLDNKYREGEDNAIHQQVFQELEMQKLKEQGEVSGATRLGKEVRRFMLLNWIDDGANTEEVETASPASQGQHIEPTDDAEVDASVKDGAGDSQSDSDGQQDIEPVHDSEVDASVKDSAVNSQSESDGQLERNAEMDEVDVEDGSADGQDSDIPEDAGQLKRKRVNSADDV
ncbi:hypothetical protein EDD37DRAFT_649287 [Exophiala viscosa]|uniref:uncharacterized protein n=1 Tax=Exophiala viscosa TaxID=2486360 RepID=UPI00219D2225|nr:hypothetical protein EDD37DRAFT_649287 [Exophiala viscosa]